MTFGLQLMGFPGGSGSKESTCNVGDPGSSPELGISPGEENGHQLQYSSWRIPQTEGPGGPESMGPQRVNTTERLTLSLCVCVQLIYVGEGLDMGHPSC